MILSVSASMQSNAVNRSLRPPVGSRDLLPLDVIQQQWVEERLRQVFQRWGYQRIITPTLERLETLTAGGSIQLDAVLQLRDAEGTMLGLRPEFTASIVRAVATRMAEVPLPIRLYYQDRVFRNSPKDQEFYQAGVELIGAASWLGDAEVLLVLADGLRELEITDWTLVVGDVGITQSLLNLLSPTARDPIRKAISHLDFVYFDTANLTDSDRSIGLQILDLRGEPQAVLNRLSQVSLPDQQRERVNHLRQLCQLLEAYGVKIVLDLSLLQRFAYYTGVVFQAVAGTDVIGLGGRYDQLYSVYSPLQDQRPGIGFTLLAEKLQRLLISLDRLPQQNQPSQTLIVPFEEAAFPAALALAQTWRKDPEARIEVDLLIQTPEAIEIYARHRHIKEVIWVQADGSYHSLGF